MRNKKYILAALWSLLPNIALAQDAGTGTNQAPKLEDLTALVVEGGDLYMFMIALGYSLAVAGMVYAGLIYLLPGSSEDRPAKSKQAIIAVITGLAVIVMSRIIVTLAGANQLISPNPI